jgi:hypothetical protein
MNAYLMVGDRCRIDNVRASAWGTARILVHIFVNTFAASRLDEIGRTPRPTTPQAVSNCGGAAFDIIACYLPTATGA